jgi:hypothetical protein
MENYILKFLTVSSVSSDSIVKGIIEDIIKTAVKTAEVEEQKTNIYNILLINMTQSCQIKQRNTFHLQSSMIPLTMLSLDTDETVRNLSI